MINTYKSERERKNYFPPHPHSDKIIHFCYNSNDVEFLAAMVRFYKYVIISHTITNGKISQPVYLKNLILNKNIPTLRDYLRVNNFGLSKEVIEKIIFEYEL